MSNRSAGCRAGELELGVVDPALEPRPPARGLERTPGISTGYWNPCSRPLRERSSIGLSRISTPSMRPNRSETCRPVAGEHVTQGRLARTVGSHDGVDLTEGDLDVEAVEDLCRTHRSRQIP
jgi:hypothetical protein